MKAFRTYDEFREMVNGPCDPQPEDFDLTKRVNEAVWGRLVGARLAVRDVRVTGDGSLWVRLESRLRMQVVTLWSPSGELRAWSIPLEDCGSIEGDRNPHVRRTMDVWAFVRQVDEIGQVLQETNIQKTIQALDLYGFKGTQEQFLVEVEGETSDEIVKSIMILIGDEARMEALSADDSEEIRVWKRTVLRLAAALGGAAEAQRETAWRLDPDNDSACGFEKNMRLAACWYEMAAKKGDGLAANNLAVYLSSDDGINHYCRKAIEYFRIAARAGISEASKALLRCEKCRKRRRFDPGPGSWSTHWKDL